VGHHGQKNWTSYLAYADRAILLVRTDPTVPKHEGLKMFFIDVRVPDDQRLGVVGQGWKVSLTTLMNERMMVAPGGLPTGFVEVLAFSQVDTGEGKAVDDPAVRARLVTWIVRTSALNYTATLPISALSKGEEPLPPERMLGLPPDMRADKGIPLNYVPGAH
jgi:acyl-CoA dehydrogenase